MSIKVVVIEDNQKVLEDISMSFSVGWSQVALISATTGAEGIELVVRESPNMIVVNSSLPDMTGFKALSAIREVSKAPVMITSFARGDEAEAVKALELGADDYITKPFAQMEFLARVKALLRRSCVSQSPKIDYSI